MSYPKPYQALWNAIVSWLFAAFITLTTWDQGLWAVIAGLAIVLACLDTRTWMKEIDRIKYSDKEWRDEV